MFIADFYCPKIKLVVEVDGSIHDIPEQNEYDIARTDILFEFGITVIRFTNEQILGDIDSIVKEITFTTSLLLEKANFYTLKSIIS